MDNGCRRGQRSGQLQRARRDGGGAGVTAAEGELGGAGRGQTVAADQDGTDRGVLKGGDRAGNLDRPAVTVYPLPVKVMFPTVTGLTEFGMVMVEPAGSLLGT